MLLVSTTIHRGGQRQKHQQELQHHCPSSPGISLQPRSYLFPTASMYEHSNIHHYSFVNCLSPPIPARSGAQLTLTEALTHMQTGTVFVGCRARKNLCRTATAPSSSSPSKRLGPFPNSDKGTVCQGTGKHTLNTRKYRTDCSRKGIQKQVRSSIVTSVRKGTCMTEVDFLFSLSHSSN